MYITKLTSILVAIAWITGVESSGSCNGPNFEISTEKSGHKRMLGHTLRSYDIRSGVVECAKECSFLTRCQSFDIHYKNTTIECELYTTDSNSVSPTAVQGWIFNDLVEWPKVVFGKCADKPCAANQRCVPTKPYTCLIELYDLPCDSDDAAQLSVVSVPATDVPVQSTTSMTNSRGDALIIHICRRAGVSFDGIPWMKSNTEH